MTLRTVFIAAVSAALLMQAPLAMAQDASAKGPYLGLSAGFNFNDGADVSGLGINRSVDLDTGWVGLGALGYRYGNGFRTELEGGWRENDVDSISGLAGGSGDVSAKSLMANVLYDVRMGGRLMPYIGGGLGYARVDYDGVGPVTAAAPGARVNGDDDVFAYQGIAGVAYWMTDALELALEYRYFATEDPGVSTNTGVGLSGEYDSHAGLVGLRWNFGGPKASPAPTPAVAAAPAPVAVAEPEPPMLPRNFLVFFDWDKSDITPEADAILRDAAAYAKANGAARIIATGHADRSGPDAYNLALSQRRAAAVKQALLAHGMAEADIGLDAKGESDPLVPTEDGVREPQNRRVEVVLR